MTTELLKLFYDAGLSDRDIRLLKKDPQFKVFMETFSDVWKLQCLIFDFATENVSVGTALARRIHAGTVGHPKNLSELDITDSELTFSYNVLHALATKHNKELVDTIHGLGKTGVRILDKTLTNAFQKHVNQWWANSYQKRNLT